MSVLVSEREEGEQFPVMMPGAGGQVSAAPSPGGQVFPPMLGEDAQLSAAMLRANQPAGAVFALGWVMAELFDPRRQVSAAVRQPPFDPDTQLPLVTDLAGDPKLVYLGAELAEYLHWFPHLSRPLQLVRAQVNRKKPAIAAEDLATARAAGQTDDVPQAETAAAASTASVALPFPDTELLAAVGRLNQAILDEFADDPERLSAYQLGLSLSDLAWLPSTTAAGRSPAASRPSALFGLFARQHLATVHTLLSGAGTQLPAGAATVVSRSLENWADWIDVNSTRIKAPEGDQWLAGADVVLRALRVQGWVWHSVLIADPEVAVQPAMGAWVEAGSAIARTAAKTGEVILRRFWPLLVFGLVLLGGLLYLVISNLSGASQVWASLAAVAAVVGSGSWSLGSGVSSALSGVGYEIWSAAKLDAAAWNITWLPALTATTAERFQMERRGVVMPQLRKNLDVS
jgi:hypothetical protein